MTYSDQYSVKFSSSSELIAVDAVKVFFWSLPAYMVVLIRFREFLAHQLRLKTANGKNQVREEIKKFKGVPGESIGLFKVLECTKTTIVTGQNDRHLDFRLVFSLTKNDAYHLTLSTEVNTHNGLGFLYFSLVKPFHRLLMPIVAKRMSQNLLNGSHQRHIV